MSTSVKATVVAGRPGLSNEVVLGIIQNKSGGSEPDKLLSFWLEWGCSDLPNSVIPTGADHREGDDLRSGAPVPRTASKIRRLESGQTTATVLIDHSGREPGGSRQLRLCAGI